MDNKDILKRFSPEDMRFIIEGYISADNNNPDAYIKAYELYVLKDMSIHEIAKHFNLTYTTIDNRIKRLVSLVLREPILPGHLAPDTDILSIPIKRLPMSERAFTCLRKSNILTVGDMLKYGEQGLLRFKNLGRKTLNEIKTVLWNLMLNFVKVGTGVSKYEGLKQHSLELAEKAGTWTVEDHERLATAIDTMESEISEFAKMLELIIHSGIPNIAYDPEKQGFMIPMAVWKRVLLFAQSSRGEGTSILNLMMEKQD